MARHFPDTLESLLAAALRFEKAIGLSFDDKTLLQRALTHRSYLNETRHFLLADNERLEFLGDAVLDFVVGEYLYHRFPEMREGFLTNLRAALVRQETLAEFAAQIDLGNHLLMGRGEADSGGRTRAGVLCAGFEAIVGALYLDQDIKTVKGFFFPLIEPVLPELIAQAELKDAKSRLQEWSQSNLRSTPRYDAVEAEGPDHAKTFTVQVTINDRVFGRGQGRSKQKASQQAAFNALQTIESRPSGHGLEDWLPLETGIGSAPQAREIGHILGAISEALLDPGRSLPAPTEQEESIPPVEVGPPNGPS